MYSGALWHKLSLQISWHLHFLHIIFLKADILGMVTRLAWDVCQTFINNYSQWLKSLLCSFFILVFTSATSSCAAEASCQWLFSILTTFPTLEWRCALHQFFFFFFLLTPPKLASFVKNLFSCPHFEKYTQE